MLRLFPSSFNLEIALSREQTNENGGKFYVYDKVNEHGKELFERMLRGAHLYCCGVKGYFICILCVEHQFDFRSLRDDAKYSSYF